MPVRAMIAKAEPIFSPRTTIPPPPSGVFAKAYPLHAMTIEHAWEPEPATVADNDDGLRTDVSELFGDVHDRDTLRPT
jgi:hypothetical protein